MNSTNSVLWRCSNHESLYQSKSKRVNSVKHGACALTQTHRLGTSLARVEQTRHKGVDDVMCSSNYVCVEAIIHCNCVTYKIHWTCMGDRTESFTDCEHVLLVKQVYAPRCYPQMMEHRVRDC